MKKILFISHDARLTGAPIVLKHHLEKLKETDKFFEFDILLRDGGLLKEDFEKIAPTYLLNDYSLISKIILRIFKRPNFRFRCLLKSNYQIVYGNTVATLDLLVYAKKYNSQHITICHVHELEIAINQFCGNENFKNGIPFIDYFLAASETVKTLLINKFKISAEKIIVHYEYIPLIQSVIKESKLKPNKGLIICGSGTLDWRKGIDLFIQTAFQLKHVKPNLGFHFYWIGGQKDTFDYEKVLHDIKFSGLINNITIIENCKNPLDYMKDADVFLLTSREDPFPLVCLEAASLGKPIICFKNSGGMSEFVDDESGWLINYLNISEIVEILNSPLIIEEIKQKGEKSKLNSQRFDINLGAEKLLQILNKILKDKMHA